MKEPFITEHGDNGCVRHYSKAEWLDMADEAC